MTYDLTEDLLDPEHLEAGVDDGDRPPAVEPAAAARGGAVVVWAALGAVWATVAVTGWARWILSDEFAPAPRGADPFPHGHLVIVRAIELASVAGLGALVWHFGIRPWRRARRLTLDGMLLVGATLAFFIDPVINQFKYTFAWNAYAYNRGSWAHFVPLHHGPSRFGEGLLWALPQYVYMGLGGAVVGCWFVGWLRRRRPGINTLTALAALFVVFWVADFVLENLFIRAEVYTYARTWRAVTLWPGSQYQFPLYEGVCVAAYALGFTWVRLSWLDRGRSFVDSGLDRFGLSAALNRGVHLLAVIGFAAACAFLAYFAPWSWLSIDADSIARLPSYLRAGG